MGSDITLNSAGDLQSKNFTLDLNGNTLTLTDVNVNAPISIKNGTVASQFYINSDVTAENVTFEVSNILSSTEGALQLKGNKNVTLKNCTFNCTNNGRPLVTECNGYTGILTMEGCTFKSNGKNPVYLDHLGSATAKVIVKNCVFEDALACEFYGQESQFTITGNTFNSTFDFAYNVTAIGALSENCKAFCNEVLSNNEFKGVNKLCVGWPIMGYVNTKF